MAENTTKNISELLQEIQQQLKAPKSRLNSHGNYQYRNAEDILEAVKPLLQKTGTYLTLNDELVNIGDRYYIKATATLGNGKAAMSTSAFAREADERKGMDVSQLTGAVSSYARKYALNGLFCIDDTKDMDFLNDEAPQSQQSQQRQQPGKSQQPIFERLDAMRPNYYNDLVQTAAENPEAKWNLDDGRQLTSYELFKAYGPTEQEDKQFQAAVANYRELFVNEK